MITLWLLWGCPQSSDDTATSADSTPIDETGTMETGDTQEPANDCFLSPAAWSGDVCVEEAGCVLAGGQSYSYFGYSLDGGGDANADGFADLVVGAPSWDTTEGTLDAGRARVFSGANLPAYGGDAVFGNLSGTWAGEYVGHEVAWVGDMTGDGVDDLVVTARGYDTHLAEAGRVALVAGEAGGWSGWDLQPTATWTGGTEYARAGHALAPLGDVDGDGIADLLVTTDLRTYNGSSESYSGGGAALIRGAAQMEDWDTSLADAAAVLTPEDSYGAAGLDMASGDFDGDGLSDVALGAPYAQSYRGAVYALPGSSLSGTVALAESPVRWVGDQSYEAYGWRLAAGDLDADGVDDLVVGVPLSDLAYPESGAVVVYRGGAEFFAGSAEVMALLPGTWDHQEAGTGLAVGDANGDGIDDLLLGSITAYQGLVTKGGRVGLVPGVAGGWADASPVVQFHGAGTKDYLGATLDLADLDGDGAAEILLGTGYANVSGTDSGAVYLFGSLE